MGWSVARPTGLTFHRPDLSAKGYTLLTPHGDDHAYLIDMGGRVVHRWTFGRIRPGYGRLLNNGNLLMTGSERDLPRRPNYEPTKPPPPFEEHIRRLGGYHTTLQEVDWDGNVVWQYDNKAQHHDFFRFPNGNTMVPEWVELPEALHKSVKGGTKRPRERLPRLLGDDLVEIDTTGKEVRRIHTWELLDPQKDPIDSQTLRWEWTHINGIDVNEAGDIVFSCRNNDRVAIIDHSSGELRWKFTKTHGQHNPTFVEDGNVLIFDNRTAASRVIEVSPATDEIVWSYEGNPGPQLFSGHISGVSRQPGGNVLLCEGTSGRLLEVTQQRQPAWEWINPFVNNAANGSPTVSIYRVHRYLPDHPALADRDLNPERFANLNQLNGLL